MGACSSKPKTTEFEGSMEPLRKTEDVSADRSIDAHVDAVQVSERSLQSLIAEPGNEIPIKSEEEEANVSTEAMQEKLELSVSAEELLKVEMSSSAEGHGFVQKDGGDEEAAIVKVSPVGGGIGGHAADGGNICDDKTIVINEVGNGVVDTGDVYMDKAVSPDAEKAHDSLLDKECITMHDNESSNGPRVSASADVGSPINGVVQCVEPIHVDDVSGSVRKAITDTAVTEDPSPSLTFEKANASSAVIDREVSTGASIREDDIPATGEEVNDLSSGLLREAENAEVNTVDDAQPEDLREGSKMSPHIVSEDEVAQESNGIGPLPETVESPNEICVKGTSEDALTLETAATELLKEAEERTSEPLGETAFDAVNIGKSHVEVTENEDNARILDELEACAPKSLQASADAEISIKPKVEITSEEVVEGKGEVIVDEPLSQLQALAVEERVEHGKMEGTSDEAIAEPRSEREGKDKAEELQAVEVTLVEAKVESTDTEIFKSSNEQAIGATGEPAFKDFSDVPSKVESSNAE